jgi:endoglucanase
MRTPITAACKNVHHALKYLALLLLASGLIFNISAEAQSSNSIRQPCQSVSTATCNLAHALGRGINMGNMLEAPREGDWGLRLDPAYIDAVQGKFTTIRLPVRWSNHAAPTADATLDEFFAARVANGVDSMLGKGFYVILNMHHYNQLFGDTLMPNEFAVDPLVLEERFVNMWRQIALRFHDRSPKLVFELLNEPHGRIGGDAWNQLAAKALAAVREIDPTRTVIIGPGNYNNIAELAKLRLPNDKNLIVAIHNYDPFAFTHQGATWLPFKLPTGVTCCSQQNRKAVMDAFDLASAWSTKNSYPLHLGEFGSLRGIDIDSREAYTRMVRDAAESRGIGWTYWEFGSAFGAYWPEKHMWIEPIRRALLD